MSIPARCIASAQAATTKGFLLALVSNVLFVIVGVLVRILSNRIHVFEILFFRQILFIIVLLPAIYTNFEQLMRPRLIKLHILRVTGAFFALLLGFITISNIPLAEATALGFLKVIFVAVISTIFLSESVGKSRQLTLLLGFTGVLLVVQPSMDNVSILYSLTGIGSALAAATAACCVRKIARTEPTINLLAYQAAFVGLLALLPSVFHWQWPSPYELTLLLLVGVISSVAQWFGVTAYKYGEANVISNVEYSQMIYSLVLGYCFFSEIPDLTSLTGAAVIIASAFLSYLFAKVSLRFWG